jgi:hypothetical protein
MRLAAVRRIWRGFAIKLTNPSDELRKSYKLLKQLTNASGDPGRID